VAVLRIRIRDTVLFDPWIRITDLGWGKNPDPESKMNIPDHISETIFGVKNTLIDADPEPGSF